MLDFLSGKRAEEEAVEKDPYRCIKLDKKTRKEVQSTQQFPEKEGNFLQKGSYRQINMNKTVGNRMCEYQNGCHCGKCRKLKISWFRLWISTGYFIKKSSKK